MRIWRISNYADLSGRGGTMGEGRWHRKGVLITYCADHPSTALLEILVHATRWTVPDVYQLIEIDIPEDVPVLDGILPGGWENDQRVQAQRQGEPARGEMVTR
jgi:RES domain-containing protein